MQGVDAVASAATGVRDRLRMPTWHLRRGLAMATGTAEQTDGRTLAPDAPEPPRPPGPDQNLARRALLAAGLALLFLLTVAAEVAVMGLLAG